MNAFIDATKDSVRVGLCNYLSFAGKGRSWVNELSPVDLPDFGGFWNRVLCDRDEPLPSNPLVLDGGQCPGVAYRVRYGSFTNGGPVQEAQASPDIFFGPLEAFDESTDTSIIQGVRGSQGNSRGVSLSRSVEPAGFRVIDIERVDGQPDNCGSQPPLPFPPAGDRTDIDITYVNNEGDTVTELGDLIIFAPVVIAPVTVVAPIRVDLPDVSFNGNIVLSPEFDIQLEPPSFRRGPGDTDSPPPPENPDTSPTTPQDDSTRRIIGAIATVTSDPSNGLATEVSSASGPDLFVPRMGTLSFRVRAANSLSWSAPIDIKTTRQFVQAPENVQVLDAVVSPNPNYSISVTLIYSDSQPSP